MCYIVTMHMEKIMRISRGGATGCLNSESMFVHISYILFCLVIIKRLLFSISVLCLLHFPSLKRTM